MSDLFRFHRRAQECIAQSYLTNSKRPEALVKGVFPTHVKHGHGAYLWDHDGKRYLDFITGLGTNLLGYGNDTVNQAISSVMRGGYSHSFATHHELEVAEKLKELFPFVDCVKFLKSGSEACSAAIKIARAAQGVAFGSQNLHEMWLREVGKRIPQEAELERRSAAGMQGLHQGVPEQTTRDGDQTAGAASLCEYKQWSGDGGEARPQTASQAEDPWTRYRLLSGKAGVEGWAYRQEFVRDMWRSERASPPPRLLEAPGRKVAMPSSSRSGTRWLVLSDGYHGHHDAFTSLTSPGAGVPSDFGILPLTGNEDLIEVAAAVIVEPVITDWSDERRKWLQDLRDRCTKAGALLIFDEVITGFRWPKFSVSSFWGITPDLIVLGKALANGMPLAAVGGKYAVMNGAEYFVSSTYAGEVLSLAAAKATMTLLQTKYSLDELWKAGEQFHKEFNSVCPDKVRIEGYPTRGVFVGDPETKAIFFQEACKAGFLFGPSFFFNFPASYEWKVAMNALKLILGRVARGECKLEGEMPRSPFAQRVREQSGTGHAKP